MGPAHSGRRARLQLRVAAVSTIVGLISFGVAVPGTGAATSVTNVTVTNTPPSTSAAR